jgi:hypothetical protein
MEQIKKISRIILIVLTAFLALTTFLGGIGLITNWIAMSVELLHGSPFSSYLIPGLALSIIVGGSALLATILLIRKSKFGLLFATTAGIVIMFFEFVEVLVIGSPLGIALTLQIFYFGLGTLITIAALGTWFIELLNENGRY